MSRDLSGRTQENPLFFYTFTHPTQYHELPYKNFLINTCSKRACYLFADYLSKIINLLTNIYWVKNYQGQIDQPRMNSFIKWLKNKYNMVYNKYRVDGRVLNWIIVLLAANAARNVSMKLTDLFSNFNKLQINMLKVEEKWIIERKTTI